MRNMNSYDTFKNKISTVRKCPRLFYIGIRKFNVIHAQLRMNCSTVNPLYLAFYALSVLASFYFSDWPIATMLRDTWKYVQRILASF